VADAEPNAYAIEEKSPAPALWFDSGYHSDGSGAADYPDLTHVVHFAFARS